MTERDSKIKPVIGITIGDFNGIGIEVILKSLAHSKILNICTPVIYGSMKLILHYRKLLNLENWHINQVQDVKKLAIKKTNLVNIFSNEKPQVEVGVQSAEAGKYAFESISRATKDLENGLIDAVVTAPINKYSIQNPEFTFPGHTEYFTEKFGKESLMLMVADNLRVGTLTGHIPLSEVSNAITRDLLYKKINILNKTLKQDFGISKPKIALLGCNPHAGEDGLLGAEEQQVMKPAIIELKKKGSLIFGPFPADGFFGTRSYHKYDAVLSTYHDQGLTPFKMLAFEEGVNFTSGLSIVRTSPDHGTAYDIAGKGIADPSSMLAAIFLACDIVKRRKEIKKQQNNP